MHPLRTFAFAAAWSALAFGSSAHAADDKKADDKKAEDKKAEDKKAEEEPAKTAEPEPEPAPAPKPAASVTVSADVAAPKTEPGRALWHPKYAAELEIHGTVAAFDKFFVGMGGGMRASFPVWDKALGKGFDNDLGFSIGIDFVRYGAYKPRDPREPKLLVMSYYVPIALQWNVWLGSRASIFLEPTLLYRFATYVDNCDRSALPCAKETRFMPTGSVGLRFRLADHFAGTLRVGWPMATLGLSWL